MPRWIAGLVVAALLAGGLLLLESGGHQPAAPTPSAPPASAAPPPPEQRLVALAPRLASLHTTARDPLVAEGMMRALVKEALVGLDDPGGASQAVRAALADARDGVRQAGWLAIGWYGPPDAELVRQMAGDLDPQRPLAVRRAVAMAAPYVEADVAAELDAPLIVASRDEDSELHRRALRALGDAARLREAPLERLIEALGNSDALAREAAAHGLARIELVERVPPARLGDLVTTLAKALDDEREGVAHYAVMALGRTGAAMEPALPRLLQALGDERALVRSNAATALAGGGQAALRAVTDALAVDDGARVEMLTWTLRLLGRAALPALDAAAERPEALVGVMAALRAWELDHDDARAVSRLVPRLDAQDAKAVLEAIRGLGRIGPPAASARPALDRVEARLDEMGEQRDLVERAVAAARAATAP
ncbi:MAG: HEAT repeat domain-containing protein [Planctomycetes bacterium]|nr:HEAT repeat domain-containing protein [Planctomycetota bacterium]MCB9829945.1 HEAT repeat domain-containing protein [Planctomycetota bacterium]MCB9900715.1 HEAT repeat domain-containing protein [Planctomycetota bacterium]